MTQTEMVFWSGQTRSTDMKIERAFIADVIANPADDTPRLIYADWLTDRDDDRGAWIRAQVALYDMVARRGINGGPEYATVARAARETTTERVLAWVGGVETGLHALGARSLASEQTTLDMISIVPGGRRGSWGGRSLIRSGGDDQQPVSSLRWRRGFPAGCLVSCEISGPFFGQAGNRADSPADSTVVEVFAMLASKITRLRKAMPLEGLMIIPTANILPASDPSWRVNEHGGMRHQVASLLDSLRGIPHLDVSHFATDDLAFTAMLAGGARFIKIPGAALARRFRQPEAYLSRPISLQMWSLKQVRELLRTMIAGGTEAVSFGKYLESRFFSESDRLDRAGAWEEATVRRLSVGLLSRRWVPLDI